MARPSFRTEAKGQSKSVVPEVVVVSGRRDPIARAGRESRATVQPDMHSRFRVGRAEKLRARALLTVQRVAGRPDIDSAEQAGSDEGCDSRRCRHMHRSIDADKTVPGTRIELSGQGDFARQPRRRVVRHADLDSTGGVVSKVAPRSADVIAAVVSHMPSIHHLLCHAAPFLDVATFVGLLVFLLVVRMIHRPLRAEAARRGDRQHADPEETTAAAQNFILSPLIAGGQ